MGAQMFGWTDKMILNQVYRYTSGGGGLCSGSFSRSGSKIKCNVGCSYTRVYPYGFVDDKNPRIDKMVRKDSDGGLNR